MELDIAFLNAGIHHQSMLHHSVPHIPTLTAFSAKLPALKIQTRPKDPFTVQAAANGAGSHVNEYLPGDMPALTHGVMQQQFH